MKMGQGPDMWRYRTRLPAPTWTYLMPPAPDPWRRFTLSYGVLQSFPGSPAPDHGEHSSRFRTTRRQLRPPRLLRLPSVLRNAEGPYVPDFSSTLREIHFASLMLFPSAFALSRKRFAGQFMSRDHEHAVRCGVRDVNHAQVLSSIRLAERYPRTFPAREVFARFRQNLNRLVLVDAMVGNVRRASRGMDVESDLQVASISY